MLNVKKFKQRQVEIWNALADTYDQSFSAVMYPAAQEMIEEVGVQSGESILDIACGTGIDAFLARDRLGDAGRIIGIDIAPKMVEVANAKAKGRGLANVSFQCMDAEKLDFDSESFEVAISKWGLMFFPDCHKALKETLRVLKPGGRFGVMVLGSPHRAKFLDVPGAVTARYEKAIFASVAEGPSAFRFGEEGALTAALNSAGFTSVRSRRLLVMIACENSDRYWNLLINGNGRYSYAVLKQPPEVQEAIAREVKRAVDQYQTEDGIRLPIEVVVGFGQKPHNRGSSVEEHYEALPTVGVDELYQRERAGLTELSAEQAHAARANGSMVTLDVRSTREYEAEHLSGAQSAPRGRLERVIRDLVPDPRTSVLVYSQDGLSGTFAARTLVDMGYVAIHHLAGGLDQWKRAGLPTESQAGWRS